MIGPIFGHLVSKSDIKRLNEGLLGNRRSLFDIPLGIREPEIDDLGTLLGLRHCGFQSQLSNFDLQSNFAIAKPVPVP